jgi:hypothetical protein
MLSLINDYKTVSKFFKIEVIWNVNGLKSIV